MTMTRKDYFNELLNIQEVAENEELVIFINKELAKLEKRSNTPKKPTKKQIENEKIAENVLVEMGEEKEYTNKEMLESFESCAGLSSQILNAILSKMLKDGKIFRRVVKRVAYFSRMDHEKEGAVIDEA